MSNTETILVGMDGDVAVAFPAVGYCAGYLVWVWKHLRPRWILTIHLWLIN